MRGRLTIVLLGGAMVLIAAGWYALRPVFITPLPGGKAAEEMNAYLDSVSVSGEPAWPIYREIIIEEFGVDGPGAWGTDEYREMNEDLRRLDVSAGAWDDDRFDRARAALERYEHTFDRLIEAAQKPRFGKRYVQGGDALSGEVDPSDTGAWMAPSILLPELTPMKRLGALLVLAMRDAAAQGRWEEYAQRLEAAIGLGDHLLRSGSFIEWRTGQEIIRSAMRELRFTLLEHELDGEVVGELDRAMRFDSAGSLASVFECERRHSQDNLDQVHGTNGFVALWRLQDHDDGILSGSLKVPNGLARLQNIRARAYPRHDESRDALDAHFDRHVERALAMDERPWLQAMADHPFVEPENEVVRPMAYEYRRGYMALAQLQRERAATILMLQIEAQIEENGWAPELSDALLLITDLSMGLPFGYERSEGGYRLFAINLPMEDERTTDFTAPRPPLEEDAGAR